MRQANHSFRGFLRILCIEMYVISEPQQCGGRGLSLLFVPQKKKIGNEGVM